MNGPPCDRSRTTHLTQVPLDRLRVSPSPAAYCLWTEGGGMEPAVLPGQLAVFEPTLMPKDGDVVVIWFKDRDAQPKVRHLLAAAHRRRSILVGLISSERVVELSLAEIDAVHVLIGAFDRHEVIREPVAAPRQSVMRRSLDRLPASRGAS